MAELADRIGGFFDGKVGEKNAIDAGRSRVVREAFKSVAEQWVQVAEEQQRNVRGAANFAHDGQEARQIGSGAQGAFGGALNNRAVGDGIGKGNAEFDEICAAAFERKD